MTHSLSVLNTDIRIHDGLYSLNDLHRAAGGKQRHKPGNWLRIDQTRELIEEIKQCSDVSTAPVKTVNGGKAPGTYVCKELVYAYAMWISATVHLAVIRAFDAMMTGKATKQPSLPAKITPRSLYDLDYVQDLRQDESSKSNVAWWRFERAGGPTNMAGTGSRAQGEHFFRQTHELALNNPEDAEQAITWSLMHLIGGSVEGVGFCFCEYAYCENIARATVAWMLAAGENATPPSHEKRRGRRRRKG